VTSKVRRKTDPLLNGFSLTCLTMTGTEEYNRRNALSAVDPVFSQTLKAYIAERLTRAQDLGMRPYWDRLDQGVKDSLTKFLS